MAWHINLRGLFNAKAIVVEETAVVFVWFLCYGINLRGLFNAKAIVVEEQQWYYLTHSFESH